MHVYPGKSEDDFLDMPYELTMACVDFARRYRASVIGG